MRLHLAFHILEEASEWLHVPYPEPKPRYNIAPGQPLIGVCNDAATRYSHLTWRSDTPNVAVEQLANDAIFGPALQARRVIVPCTGFYVWNAEGRPHFIGRADRKPLFIAGLWSLEAERHCVLLTAPSHDSVRAIHTRMPLLLRRESWRPWLNRNVIAADAALALLEPDRSEVLATHEVEPLVNDPANDQRACLLPKKQ